MKDLRSLLSEQEDRAKAWSFCFKRTQGKDSKMAAEEWKTGWPKRPGWYRCLVDGDVEMDLKFYICQVSCKPHWIDEGGDYIETQYKVKWKEK